MNKSNNTPEELYPTFYLVMGLKRFNGKSFTLTERVVYLHMLSEAKRGSYKESKADIARRLGISISTVKRNIKGLKDKCLLLVLPDESYAVFDVATGETIARSAGASHTQCSHQQ